MGFKQISYGLFFVTDFSLIRKAQYLLDTSSFADQGKISNAKKFDVLRSYRAYVKEAIGVELLSRDIKIVLRLLSRGIKTTIKVHAKNVLKIHFSLANFGSLTWFSITILRHIKTR